jgi:hypothetical protein
MAANRMRCVVFEEGGVRRNGTAGPVHVHI